MQACHRVRQKNCVCGDAIFGKIATFSDFIVLPHSLGQFGLQRLELLH